MGKIGQNPKTGQFWRPVAPQPYATQKSWLDLGISLALGVQCGVNSISLQCIPWPVACSEWGACLTDFWFQILGANDPQSKNFPKYISGFIDGICTYVSWPNLVKIGRWEVAERSSELPQKNLALRGTRSSPYFAQNRPIAPKIPWTLSPLDLSTYTEFGPDRLPDLFWKDWFFGPKSKYL